VNGRSGRPRSLPFIVYRSRLIFPAVWTGVRVAEGAGLENRCTRKGIVGSNPTLSVAMKPVVGSALIFWAFTTAVSELFVFARLTVASGEYTSAGDLGGDILLLAFLPPIVLGAVALTVVCAWFLTRGQALGLAQRILLPGISATLAGLLAISLTGQWILSPIRRLAPLPREVAMLILTGGVLWVGARLVHGPKRVAAA
jgi:hypothetical protein